MQIAAMDQSYTDTLAFIKTYIEHGDIKEACDMFKVDRSLASKILKGKAGIKADFLHYLKTKADKNFAKLRLQHK